MTTSGLSIVVDTSALLTILLGEPDAQKFANTLAGAREAQISAASILEAHIVILHKFGEAALFDLDSLVREARLKIESITVDQLDYARRAYVLYGKGRHVAGLNFGDCFAYALAKLRGQPLLYKGDDFSKTDIQRA